MPMDPVGYARSLGVQMGTDVHFYEMRPGMFSTEPWLIRLGSHVHVTSGVQFVTHDGGTLVLRHKTSDLEVEVTAPISVGDRVYIGMNSIILPGVTIGDDVVIGAGSVVSRSIPAGVVAAGVPAKIIKSLDQYHSDLLEKSLGFGHLSAADKEAKLREHFRSFIEENRCAHLRMTV